MPLHRRSIKSIKPHKMPVSFRANVKDRMRDAKNCFTNQDVLETRHGISRVNSTALDNDPVSISHFKSNSGTRITLVKDGTKVRKLAATGAHTDVKTGLTDGQKYRAVTINGRHITAHGSDGLFSYDGTTWSQLGQDPPSAPTVASSGSGNTLTASDYQVALTFVSSTYGFETNIGTASSTVTVASGEQIDISDIPNTAANGFIDKVYIYLKDVTANGDFLFWDEVNLGTTTDTIDADPTSTQTPPTTNAAPLAGGGKYLSVFGSKLVYSGNATFPNEVYFSEEYLPDAFNNTVSALVLTASGSGGVTGLATGLFNDSELAPYLIIFTETSIELYSELGGVGQQVMLEDNLGCVAPDTIKVIDGDIYFMSNKGWHVISNGRLLKEKRRPVTLADRDIDDIFTRSGYVYELNKSDFDNFFSVYYPTFEHYMTFVSEGANTTINKAHNYEFQIGGFRPYIFPVSFQCGCRAINSDGEDVVYLGGEGGYVYTHSSSESRNDVDADGNAESIDVFGQMFWVFGDDLESSYNFGPFTMKALSQSEPVTFKYFLSYSLQDPSEQDFDFNQSETGFILDVSMLDVGILGDGRTIVKYNGEILKSGESLLIGFYQNVADGNIGLLEGQLDVQKNGNPN